MISGAILLPFGFLTDVSASALAAGAGGLKGFAAPANGGETQTGFEAELTELMEAFPSTELASVQGAEDASGIFAIPSDIIAPLAGPVPVLSGNSQEQASEPAEAVEPLLGALGGGQDAPAGAPVPQAPASGQANAPGVLPNAGAAPLTSTPAASAPVPRAPEMPLPFVPSKAISGVEAVPDIQAKGPVVVTSSQPVPAKSGGEEVAVAQLRPEPGVVQAAAADAHALSSSGAAATPDVPQLVETKGAEELVTAKAPLSNQPAPESGIRTGRRWQNELPEDLRAPIKNLSRQVPPAQDQETTSLKATPEGAGVTAAGPLDDDAPLALRTEPQPSGTGVDAKKPIAAPVPPQGNGSAEPVVRNAVAGVEPEATEAAVKTVSAAVLARAAAQSSAGAPSDGSVTSLTPETVVSAEGDTFDPEPLVQTTKDQAIKASASSLTGEKVSDGAQAAKAPDPAARGTAAVPEIRPAASVEPAPAANAFLAAQISAEELALIQQPWDGSASGEFAATIRGGDISGAIRTESLQVPGQAQSGQVSMQVAAEIARNLKNGQTRFQMRFDPPELGRVDVNMRVGADGGVHAHLIVERPETLDMFLRDQRGLERALEAAGLSADSENLQFSLKQEGGREFASGDGQSDQSTDAAQPQDSGEPDESGTDTENIVQMTLAGRPGGLDLKI